MKPRRPIAPEEDLTWRTSRRSVSARERRNADLFLADLMGHGARPPFEDQGEGAELEVGPSGLEPIFGDPRDESWRVVARPGERVDVETLRGPDGRLRDDTMVLRRVSRGSRRAPGSEATDEAFDIVDPWPNDPRPNPRPRPGPGYTPPGVVNPWPDPPLQWNPAYLPSAARSAADYKATLGPIKAASEIEGKDRKGRPRKGTPVGPARLTVEHMMQIYAAAKVAAMLGPKGADGHRPKEAKIAVYVDHINDAFRIMRIDTVEAQALFIAHSVGETGLSKLTEGQINSFEDDPANVRVDTSLMTDKKDPEGKQGQVLGPRRYSRSRHAESGTVDPLRLIPDNGPMDENQFDKTFIGRGAIQVTHVHNYQHVLMVLERRADDLQKEIDANPNAPDAKQKAHDVAKLREVVAAVAADPSQAARPEYTFLFTMGHMHASPMVKVAAVLDKNEDFGGKGRASAGMTGGRADHRGQFKHDAYVKAYEILAKKAAPLGEAAGSSSAAPESAGKLKLTFRVNTYKPPHPAVPLSGATARVVGGSASSTSDAQGNAVLTIDPGKHTIRFDAADHFPAAVTLDLQSDYIMTMILDRKALVGPRLRSSAWVNGTQDKLPMFKSSLAAGHCDSVIWQLFFVNGKGPDGYSRRGARGVNFQEWDRSKFKAEVDRIHAIGALALCEWVRAEETGDFAVFNNMLLGRGSVSMAAFKKAILEELDAYCKAGVFWDGVSFDLENVGISPSKPDAVAVRDAMTAFMDDLGKSLHQSGRLLSVTIGAKTFDSVTDPKRKGVNDAAPGEGAMQFVYDWKGLGQAAVDYLPCMCYSADASNKNINFSDKVIQQTLVHAGKTCGFDKFLLGVSPDDGRLAALTKLARASGCGISVFTANSGKTWGPVDAALNPNGPLACFAEQPKGTPQTTLDLLNKRDPPEPPACPP